MRLAVAVTQVALGFFLLLAAGLAPLSEWTGALGLGGGLLLVEGLVSPFLEGAKREKATKVSIVALAFILGLNLVLIGCKSPDVVSGAAIGLTGAFICVAGGAAHFAGSYNKKLIAKVAALAVATILMVSACLAGGTTGAGFAIAASVLALGVAAHHLHSKGVLKRAVVEESEELGGQEAEPLGSGPPGGPDPAVEPNAATDPAPEHAE